MDFVPQLLVDDLFSEVLIVALLTFNIFGIIIGLFCVIGYSFIRMAIDFIRGE